MNELLLLLTAVLAGGLGAILGIGGGIIMIPVMTLFYHIDIRYAIAASLVSIVATSSGAAASYLKDHMTNLRLAVFLEIGTVSGAITGFLLSSTLPPHALSLLFGIFLVVSALLMLRKPSDSRAAENHPWAEKLKLYGAYPDEHGVIHQYKVSHVPWGLAAMFGAGVLSAMLGIGSGIFKVMAMDNAMQMPIKPSSATSNFMIGVTASASAGAYLLQGAVRPEIAAPVALGIIAGSFFGAKIMMKMPAILIRRIFVVVLAVVAFQMILKGIKP